MSACNLQIITLRLLPPFVQQLKEETQFAMLVQGVHTFIPDSLLQLATLVLANLEIDPESSATSVLRSQ